MTDHRPQSMVQGATQVASGAIEAMKGSPISIVLLVVNLGFLGFLTYVLGEVSSNTRLLDKTQMELITRLVTDIRDCRQGPKQSSARTILRLPALPPLPVAVQVP